MEASYRYFENHACKYYPCHEGLSELNCLFCYCPLYNREDCPGNPHWKVRDGRRVKSCVCCTFPHEAGNYEVMMQILHG